MAQTKINQKLKDRVANMLYNYPELRDNDARLVANMWYYELPSGAHFNTAAGVLESIANGTLTSYESISRARRQLQQNNPSLRGKNYTNKQSNQTNVRQDLGYNK